MILTPQQQALIIALRKNGRQRIHSLAKKNLVPTSSLTETLHRLEEKGILMHRPHLAFDKLGYPVRILAAVTTDPRGRQALQSYLEGAKNVNTLHVIDSGYDFHFEGIFRNQKDAQDFMNEMEEKNIIVEKHVFHIIDTIHQERFMTEGSHFENPKK